MPQVADLPSVETVEPVGGADVQQYVTYVRLQDQAIYKDEVLRQTEEANVIVASSYNAVAKWSLMNSLNKVLRIRSYEARTAASRQLSNNF